MPHVIITGGSSGIGLAIARIYRAKGWRVSLIARREDMLNLAAQSLNATDPSNQSRIFIAPADVSEEKVLREAIKRAEATHGPCDVLVTSAGRVDPQYFNEQSASEFEAQMSVNFLGTVYAIRAVLGGMKNRARGRIVVISSGAALVGIPGYTAYCASKSALSAFSEALRTELVRSGVTLTVSFPPDTLTPQYYKEMPRRPTQAQQVMGHVSPWPVEKVAKKIVSGAEKGISDVHFGAALKLISMFSPFIKPVLFWRLKRLSA